MTNDVTPQTTNAYKQVFINFGNCLIPLGDIKAVSIYDHIEVEGDDPMELAMIQTFSDNNTHETMTSFDEAIKLMQTASKEGGEDLVVVSGFLDYLGYDPMNPPPAEEEPPVV